MRRCRGRTVAIIVGALCFPRAEAREQLERCLRLMARVVILPFARARPFSSIHARNALGWERAALGVGGRGLLVAPISPRVLAALGIIARAKARRAS